MSLPAILEREGGVSKPFVSPLKRHSIEIECETLSPRITIETDGHVFDCPTKNILRMSCGANVLKNLNISEVISSEDISPSTSSENLSEGRRNYSEENTKKCETDLSTEIDENILEETKEDDVVIITDRTFSLHNFRRKFIEIFTPKSCVSSQD